MSPTQRPVGRRLPAEWELQTAVMLTWPHGGTDWAEEIPEVEALYLQLAHHITRYQRALIICRDPSHQARVRKRIEAAGIPRKRTVFAIAPSNDSWARDHGPLTVITPDGPELMDFRFNGWGGKYPAELDNRVTAELSRAGLFEETPRLAVDLVLEGGAVETDGSGTLLATKSAILSESRNPGRSREEIEQLLGDKLGLHRFLWLEQGQLSGDDTDGHIDTLARFCDPDTIIHVTALHEDEDHPVVQAMVEELSAFRTAEGRPYRLVPLPAPRPCHDTDGRRLSASYANFLIINGAVLLPVYNDPADAQARQCLKSCFPGREIIPLDCRPLIRQNGSLHCITMQVPDEVNLLTQ